MDWCGGKRADKKSNAIWNFQSLSFYANLTTEL